MTKHPRPSEWIALLREEAKENGRPLLGMAMPAVLPVASGAMLTYGHKRGTRMVATSLLSSGKSGRLDADLLLKILLGAGYSTSAPGAVVLPDEATALALLAQVEAERSEAGRKASRALSMCLSLTSSRHVVVLTRALERKFFAPAGMDTQDIGAWRSAFSLSGLSAMEADRRLYEMVVTGPGGLQVGEGALTANQSTTATFRQAVRAEESILKSLDYTGIASECSRFSSAGVVSAVWSFITATDPERRDLSALDGTVFSAKIVKAGSQRVYARISPPFKARVGKRMIALSSDVAGDIKRDPELLLEDVQANAAGEFVAHLVPNSRQHLPFSTGDTIDLVASPFIPHPVRTARTRWTSNQVEGELTYREVPLSVSLAGAPQDADLQGAA